jgi:hypothetical protein
LHAASISFCGYQANGLQRKITYSSRAQTCNFNGSFQTEIVEPFLFYGVCVYIYIYIYIYICVSTRSRQIMVLESKLRPVRRADSLTAICEPTV